MQAIKPLALVLAVVLSPRIATADVVRPIDHSGVESVASGTTTVEQSEVAAEGDAQAATIASDDSDQDESGAPSAPRAKKRWGSLRRLPLVRRPRAPVLGHLEDDDVWAQLLSISSFSKSAGVRGLAKR